MTVEARVTTDVAGNPNTAASQVLKYRPPSHAVSAVQKTANAVVATSLAASVAAGLLSGGTTTKFACHCDFSSCMFYHHQVSFYAIVTCDVACFTTISSPSMPLTCDLCMQTYLVMSSGYMGCICLKHGMYLS